MSLARARRWAIFMPLALSLAFAQPALASGKGKQAAPPPAPVHVQTFQEQLAARAGGEIGSFYAYRDQPLWTHADGSLDPAAFELLKLIQTADEDGLDPATLHAAALAQAINAAQTNATPDARATAEVMLSQAFAAYVASLRSDSPEGMKYEAKTLAPQQIGAYYTLTEAAKAPSLAEYVHDMRWMHPLYAPLRQAVMADAALTPDNRLTAVRNLERIRQIPAQPNGRHIIIDSAKARLWMYDGDKAVDSMRVVVGKPEKQTPAYAGYIRSAYLNPYWNVPPDMVRSIIAKNVLNQGMGYLKRQGYEVTTAYGAEGVPIDPLTIDWAAVQRGDVKIFVRQKPGPRNSMGTMKYEFPNPYGIYLHDTPEKETLEGASRQESAGCIRLEDAKRLGSWLMEGDIQKLGNAPEQKIELPKPVPVYITYLTAHVGDGGQIAFGPDPYSRDGVALATAN